MVTCFLSLGSNLGPRRRHLGRALARLGRLDGCRVLARSRVHETAPDPPSCGGPFLNCAVRLATRLSPMGLLAECKRLEALAGRRPGRRWGPRPLDVDIIDFGGRRLRGPWLTLPHPRAARRPFVLAPLAELAPSLRLAGGATAARRLARCLARLKRPPETVRIAPCPARSRPPRSSS
ncbi:MAG: 2-amino-4-hydroxy-6-hydroxymethyldihydropteridine diphosphokinase [Elusimicrobia bacterium]|nr:2-amino-4-hydroxy-6-hydroxymethyldihydropteridine diphosphokinase [Elusimicrobiota bacterium]